MTIQDRGKLKQDAFQDLACCSYDPKKLMLIHAGATIALSLLLALMDFVLDQQIGGTGGLGGVGARAVLETVQSVLAMGQGIAVLFWQIGYVYTALRISRRQEVGPGSLLEGFRRFGPVLRLRLLIGLRVLGLGFGGMYLASLLFSVTPWGEPVAAAIESGSEALMMAAMEASMVPWLILVVLVEGVLLVPYLYQIRMAEFALMEDPRAGARVAILKSRLLMYKNRWNLFKLDLSFWWFYLLEAVTALVFYGDLIVELVGVDLGVSGDLLLFISCAAGLALQFGLYVWRQGRVLTSYAVFYEKLVAQLEAQAAQLQS